MEFPKITEAIEKLRQLTQVSVQANWRYCETDLAIPSGIAALHAPDALPSDWPLVQLNEKGHIAWEAGRQVLWLTQQLIIPPDLHGYPLEGLALRLAVSWWAEDAQIFVNGKLVQQGDLFDSSVRLLLSPSVKIGEEFLIALRLVSPGHDRGALVRSHCVYEASNYDNIDPGFMADELAVLQEYLSNFDSAKLDNLALTEIDWSALPDREKFERSLLSLRQNLLKETGCLLNRILLLGHAHLDLAWLWPVSETWEAAQRTFESALQLQKDFPELIFCHSTPALYAWIEENRPDLFAAIKQQVAAGRWEVVGGMWVEPDLNLIDGESIIRQVLYGQRYTLEKFGQLMPVVWVPDSFGFCWQLPQILKQGGVEYFVTQKLRWNDTTKFPYGVFWWRSPDGSQIFSFMSALIGESIDPLKMVKYVCEWEKQTNLKESLWLPGVGDHGGGPTRDMLEIARRWQKSPFFPPMEFSSAIDYLRRVELSERTAENAEGAEGRDERDLGKEIISKRTAENAEGAEGRDKRDLGSIPVWNDELYLEFHRGCYTTHAEQKRWNRRCEGLLYQAELFATLAMLSAGVPYPLAELEAAWKKVLFNQFHDILPGSSIPEVYVDANRDWVEVERVGSEILQGATLAIASQISLPSPPHPDAQPIVVFNSLNWERSEVVEISLPDAETAWQICDLEGTPLLAQKSECTRILFLASNIPSVGYRVFWLYRFTPLSGDAAPKSHGEGQHNTSISADFNFVNKVSLAEKDWILENEFLRIKVEAKTGNLSSIFDKVNQREVLKEGGGNQLQAFQDKGQYWDAWNIDPNYAQYPLDAPLVKEILWVERGEVRSRLRVLRQLGESEFCQDYLLDVRSPLLKIVTTVNWQESHVLVKAAFPLELEADFATYEIPCAAIQRTTKPQMPEEKAKWEVPALRWADLSDDSYGVSLLNDCKYGYDAQPSQLRLTLLRSPKWPDPEADRGIHEFTYALYPHSGNWQDAETVRRGYELNLPLQVIVLQNNDPQAEACGYTNEARLRGLNKPAKAGFVPVAPPLRVGDLANSSLPPVCQFLDLSAENLILIAFKRAEDDPNTLILRCYECHGAEAQLNLKSDWECAIAHSVDLLERAIDLPINDKILKVAPWKIASFAVTFATETSS